ncbi:hypothetical protein JIN87_24375 [Pelagicoccus mobilis]|uniref:Uncharacterized protein n=1 Tax=Pelagicoccus mobilis TaxID=415221 RepID=A0A934VTS9_9BACT|nr:hypothetical protein [Pelagicoccus mobilis]
MADDTIIVFTSDNGGNMYNEIPADDYSTPTSNPSQRGRSSHENHRDPPPKGRLRSFALGRSYKTVIKRRRKHPPQMLSKW